MDELITFNHISFFYYSLSCFITFYRESKILFIKFKYLLKYCMARKLLVCEDLWLLFIILKLISLGHFPTMS